MNGASPWIRCERVGRAYDEVQWRVKSRTWDWWGSPAVRYGFSSRKSNVFESLRSLRAWHMPSNGCLFQNARSSVDRSSTLDTSSSASGRGYMRFTPQASSRRRCCFVNYKLSDRRSHAHGGRVYPVARIKVSVGTPDWPDWSVQLGADTL